MSVLKAALLGKELSHSLSRPLHHELFKILRSKFSPDFAECVYDLVECPEESDLEQWLKTAQANCYIGANITYPYKGNAFTLSDRHVGSASSINSANCLSFVNNEVVSVSTDGEALLTSILREYPAFDMNRYHLVLYGAGSAARAAVYALCTHWMPKSLTLVNRSIAKAESLAEFCIAQAPGPTVRVMSINDIVHSLSEERYRLVLQCTPLGQIDHPGDPLQDFSWHETDFALDLVYNPARTTFLRAASHAGAKTMNGLGMLIEQAALSQVFWMTGLLPDASPLSETEFQSLKDILTNSLSA